MNVHTVPSGLSEHKLASPFCSPYGWIMIVMLLLLSTHGAVSVFGSKANVSADTGIFNRLTINILIWTIGTFLMLKGFRVWSRRIAQNKLLFAMPIVALASTLWSKEPQTTLSTSVFLLLTTAFAIFFATYFTAREQMRFIMAAGAVASIASLGLGLFVPSVGLDKVADVGALQGIYVGKNVCALSTAFFLITALYYKPRQFAMRVVKWFYILLMLALIVLTRSRTGVALAFVFIAISVVLKILSRSRRPFVVVPILVTFAIAILGGTVVWLYLDQILVAINSDAGLHGRGPLWQMLWTVIKRQPWLGYGYTGFWTDQASLEVDTYVGWYPNYAHNGVLEVVLAVGFIGFLCLVPIFLRALKDSLLAFYWRNGEYSDWYIAIVLATFFYNFDEAFFASFDNLNWVLFLVSAICLSSLRKQRTGAVAQQTPPFVTSLRSKPSLGELPAGTIA